MTKKTYTITLKTADQLSKVRAKNIEPYLGKTYTGFTTCWNDTAFAGEVDGEGVVFITREIANVQEEVDMKQTKFVTTKTVKTVETVKTINDVKDANLPGGAYISVVKYRNNDNTVNNKFVEIVVGTHYDKTLPCIMKVEDIDALIEILTDVRAAMESNK